MPRTMIGRRPRAERERLRLNWRDAGVFFWIAGLCTTVELALWGATLLPGAAMARFWAIDLFGFWPGRLGTWQFGLDLRPVTMFATYWLLHAGPLHLLGNMAILAWLERKLSRDLRPGAVWEIWIASVLGGAIAFGLLATSAAPMVGASGGVFGLLGALVVLRHRAAILRGVRFAAFRTLLVCVGLAVLSAADFLLRDAVLAWQGHLGGFVAGAIMAALGKARRRRR